MTHLPDVHGIAADGFEHVVDAFRASAVAGAEMGAATAITVEGELVVDLWWGETADGPWARDTLVPVFSCTKGMASLCIHLLADRGLLDVDAPIARYWPEFAAAGKEAGLVRHILNHSLGLLTVPEYPSLLGPRSERLVDDRYMASLLADAPLAWEAGTGVGYHALTFGWLTGELVRRIDGRSIGRFFAEEVAAPLGLDAWIGTPPEVHGRIARSEMPEPPTDPEVLATFDTLLRAAREAMAAGNTNDPAAAFIAAVFTPADVEPTAFLVELVNAPATRVAELAGGNGIADARSLARMYAPLANEGAMPGGGRLVSPESIALFRQPRPLPDGTATGYGLGYAIYGQGFGGPGVPGEAFGHSGAGGNLAFADPTRRLSYAYVKNKMVYDGEAAWRPVRAHLAHLAPDAGGPARSLRSSSSTQTSEGHLHASPLAERGGGLSPER